MSEIEMPYLQVTYRRGEPIIAYYYLARRIGEQSARTLQRDPDLVVDVRDDGQAMGIEILSPDQLTLEAFNRTLEEFHLPPVEARDLAPLRVA